MSKIISPILLTLYALAFFEWSDSRVIVAFPMLCGVLSLFDYCCGVSDSHGQSSTLRKRPKGQ